MIIDKDKYKEYQKVKELKEETRSYLISDNLSDTRASKFMKKVNSGAKLMPQHIPKPRLGNQINKFKRDKDDKEDDDVLRSLEPIDYKQ